MRSVDTRWDGSRTSAVHSSCSAGTQQTWDQFYSLRLIWHRSRFLRTLRSRLAFLLISELYRQMYANTGIATDSARTNRSARWARWLARPCRRLFVSDPVPDLQNAHAHVSVTARDRQ